MSNFSQYTDNNEKKWWKGEETQNQQIQEYDIETEGKYVDRDIKLKVSIPSANILTDVSVTTSSHGISGLGPATTTAPTAGPYITSVAQDEPWASTNGWVSPTTIGYGQKIVYYPIPEGELSNECHVSLTSGIPLGQPSSTPPEGMPYLTVIGYGIPVVSKDGWMHKNQSGPVQPEIKHYPISLATFSTSQSLPSEETSEGTIENGTYLKISAGFNPSDTYYLAEEFSENEAKEILGEATFDKSWSTGLISQELPLLYTLPEENSSNEYYTISAYSEGTIYSTKTGYINQGREAKSFQDFSANAYIKKFTGKYTTND